MDNAAIYKSKKLKTLKNSLQVQFLAPYSPFLNPIEEFFGEIKHYFRKNNLLYRK